MRLEVMRYDECVRRVTQDGRLDDPNQAEIAIVATVEVLLQRLGETDRWHTELPAELQRILHTGSARAEAFDVDEFCRRLADRMGSHCTRGRARRYAHAVMSTLRSSFSAETLSLLRSQMPPQYAFLLAELPEEPLAGAPEEPAAAAAPTDDRGAIPYAAAAASSGEPE